MSESQDELTPARQGQLLDAAVEGMAWALIEDETDTVDRGVSPEHYRDAVQRAKTLLPMLVAAPAGVVAEEPEWEYRYAEIYDGGEMYTYGPKGDPDRSFATSDAADGARIDDTDIVVRRRKAGPWVPVEQGDET